MDQTQEKMLCVKASHHSTNCDCPVHATWTIELKRIIFVPQKRRVLDTLLLSRMLADLSRHSKSPLKKVLVYQIAALLFANQVLHLQ